MSAATVTIQEPELRWGPSSRGRVGMYCLIAAETAIFTIFVVAYLFYLGKSISGPTPAQVLHVPMLFTICLLSSSVTIHLAVRSLRKAKAGAFARWWFLTFFLGATFLAGTALEWRHLVVVEGLSISTNLFGTTFYSLVGLHGVHVTVGLLLIGIVAIFSVLGKITREQAARLAILSLYWHFVDAVWVVVFTVVYVLGR